MAAPLPQHLRSLPAHRCCTGHPAEVGAAIRRAQPGAHDRWPTPLHRDGRATRGMAPRPDPRRLAYRRGSSRSRRGELGGARRAGRPPRRTHRVDPGLRAAGALGDARSGVRRAPARAGADRGRSRPPCAGPAKHGTTASCRSRRSTRSRPRCGRISGSCSRTGGAASTVSPCLPALPASSTTSACSCSRSCSVPTAGVSSSSVSIHRSIPRSRSPTESAPRCCASAPRGVNRSTRCASRSRPADRRPTAALVVGGAAVDSETARELRAIYADGQLDLAVARLRRLAAVAPG